MSDSLPPNSEIFLNPAPLPLNAQATDFKTSSTAVKAASILHDIGIHEAERKYNSNAGKYQEIEGPPIAENVLKNLEIPLESIEHICKIIANHVNLSEEIETFEKEKIRNIVEKRFKTKTGLQIAQKLFC